MLRIINTELGYWSNLQSTRLVNQIVWLRKKSLHIEVIKKKGKKDRLLNEIILM